MLCAQWSGGGRRLFSSGDDDVVRMWETVCAPSFDALGEEPSSKERVDIRGIRELSSWPLENAVGATSSDDLGLQVCVGDALGAVHLLHVEDKYINDKPKAEVSQGLAWRHCLQNLPTAVPRLRPAHRTGMRPCNASKSAPRWKQSGN